MLKRTILVMLWIFLFKDFAFSQTDKDLCDFQKVTCLKKIGSIEVSLDISPKPLKAFTETEFIADLRGIDKLPSEILVELSMPGMYMGENQIILKRVNKNRYKGRGVIPRCPSGATLWQAGVSVPGHDKVYFKFHVK